MPDELNTPLSIIGTIVVIGIMWKILQWIRKVDLSKQEWTSFTETTFPALMKEIRGDIRQILLRLPPPTPVASGGSRQLTEFGQKIGGWLHANQWAAQLAPHLMDEASGKQPFQIDEFSDDYVQTQLRTLTEITLLCAERPKPQKTGSAWMHLATLYRSLS